MVGIADGKPLGFSTCPTQADEAARRGRAILKLFGGAPEGAGQDDKTVAEIGPTRLAFWDCALDPAWVSEMRGKQSAADRDQDGEHDRPHRGVAEHPRNTERVPAGARFEFRLTIKVLDGEELLPDLLRGLRLLELTGIGGSGSRGYGKLRFTDLTLDGDSLMTRLAAIAI